MKCIDILILIRHVTLWPWALTRWPWKFVLHLLLHGHSLYHSKFDRYHTIPCWVIDNLANFSPYYVTLWPWPLTPWPWTCVEDWVSCGQSVNQIWARSVNPWLSYWWLTTDFRLFLEGARIPAWVFYKTHGPICTKFGGDIVRSSLHTKFKNGEDILLGF